MPNTGSGISEAEEASRKGMVAGFILNLILSYFCPSGLIYMVSMINALQIILHLPIMNISVPANTMSTFENIVPIVAFDVI